MKLKLIEPVKDLFKDEVRKVGYELKIPSNFIKKTSISSPGLAIRIMGEINEERLTILEGLVQLNFYGCFTTNRRI